MSRAFKGAAQAVHSLIRTAQRSKRPEFAHQAQIIARMVQGLERLERSFESEGQQLSAALLTLNNSIRSKGKGPSAGGDADGYYVRMVGDQRNRRGGPRPADTGLIGRRVGRGPVRMGTVSGVESTKALSAAFARLLSASEQLQQLKSDIERLKKRGA